MEILILLIISFFLFIKSYESILKIKVLLLEKKALEKPANAVVEGGQGNRRTFSEVPPIGEADEIPAELVEVAKQVRSSPLNSGKLGLKSKHRFRRTET